ncbi:MAG: zinc ribbon domain-containing protein [Dehalococcoidia bacterium]|jgi:putative FmdB family regulatory protein|nr:zinc ribbon domain-containing protein [Dehalococcoidia bacterium]
MPLYEYYCEHCHGVFELLRPAREASTAQPCPECDDDSRRIASNFQAFVFRDGYPRKIPDDGTYWHLGTKVSEPVNKAVQANEHPELVGKKRGPTPLPTAEERDAHETLATEYADNQARSAEGAGRVVDPTLEKKLNSFGARVAATSRRRQLKRRRKPNTETTARTVSGKHKKS